MNSRSDIPQQRLPPGQQLAASGKWPVVGEREPLDAAGEWTIDVAGQVEHPQRWSLAELRQFEVVERVLDIHCVTRWSLFDVPVRGVRLETLLRAAEPKSEARFISFVAHTSRRHSTSLPIDDAVRLDALVVWSVYGQPLSVEHGGPVRMIVPGKYFYKSVKWLRAIELLAEDRLGYWESDAGYHNHADPWNEERFVAADLSRVQIRELMQSRDWSGRNLRGIEAADMDLASLAARGAVLRAADFRRADLRGADFSRANLSNSRFGGADLRSAAFLDADIEGCDFAGADLRGADLRTLSLLGVSFVSADTAAKLDGTTRFSPASLEQLADRERQYVEASL